MTKKSDATTEKPTRVFVCWSGQRSLAIASKLCGFLETVIPELKGEVFYSEQLAKGVRWFDEIVRKLEGAKVGIICLTAENLTAPWLHFEAGALAKQLHGTKEGMTNVGTRPGSIFTYLHGATPASLSGPLAQYQSTSTTREDTRALVNALVVALSLPSDAEARVEAFDAAWPEFERATRRIGIMVHDLLPKFERWFSRKTFEEPLQQCTDQNWLARYDGARETRNRLDDNVSAVRSACMPYQVDLYEQLRTAMDSYAMTIRGLLLEGRPAAPAESSGTTGRRFKLGPTGELEIDAGVLQACETRRQNIREIVSRMLDPLAVPATSKAVTFWLTDSFEQRKMLVHQIEHEVQQERDRRREDQAPAKARGTVRPMTSDLSRSRRSTAAALVDFPAADELRPLCHKIWDLDRVFGYLCAGYLYPHLESTVAVLVEAGGAELDRVRARGKRAKLMPLYYTLGALKTVLLGRPKQLPAPDANTVSDLCTEIVAVIADSAPAKPSERDEPERGESPDRDETPTLDGDGKVRRTIGEIQALLAPRHGNGGRRASQAPPSPSRGGAPGRRSPALGNGRKRPAPN